jgi:hypothetical protein
MTIDLNAWWETQRFDIEVDRALLAVHWHRVCDREHVCDAGSRCSDNAPAREAAS